MAFRSTKRTIKLISIDSSDSKKSKTIYPSVTFNEKELPQIKDWKVGDEYEVVIKVKQRSIADPMEKNEPVSASFDIMAVSSNDSNKDGKKVKDMLKNRKKKNGNK